MFILYALSYLKNGGYGVDLWGLKKKCRHRDGLVPNNRFGSNAYIFPLVILLNLFEHPFKAVIYDGKVIRNCPIVCFCW